MNQQGMLPHINNNDDMDQLSPCVWPYELAIVGIKSVARHCKNHMTHREEKVEFVGY